MAHVPVPGSKPFDQAAEIDLPEADSDTMVDVRAVERTVDDLIVLLGEMPADAKVALTTRHGGEAESFTVEYDEDTGWVTLAG